MNATTEGNSWFALKVHFNRTLPIKEQLISSKTEFFVPDMIPSLLFIRCSLDFISQFEQANFHRIWVYRNPSSPKPTPIQDREMELFIFVCTAGKQGLTYLGEDKPEYHQGDRVRVTDGPLKGAEGNIKRIKKDRRLVVSIRGIAAVATTYIHPLYLEKV